MAEKKNALQIVIDVYQRSYPDIVYPDIIDIIYQYFYNIENI